MKNRTTKLEAYKQAHHHLMACLENIPQMVWKYKPSVDEWSIHEVIIHLADAEANAYIRCLKAIAEPGGVIMPLEEKDWTNNLKYHEQDPNEALELFKLLRSKTYTLLDQLSEEEWIMSFFNHPEGGKVTLDEWLDTYENHTNVHIRQINRVFSQHKKNNQLKENQ